VLVAAANYFIFGFTSGQIGGEASGAKFGAITQFQQLVVLAVFLLSFVLIWFLLYVQYIREAEDIYSRLREKLCGIWQVKYEIYPGQYGNSPFDQVPALLSFAKSR
jgi:hypothetical protein